MEFTLEREQRPLTIDGEEYVLVELDGKERDKYLTSLGNRLKPNPGGGQSVRNFDGLEASLVSASLFKLNDGGRVPVSKETIQAWPARVISALFKEAKALSALGVEEGEDDDSEGKD